MGAISIGSSTCTASKSSSISLRARSDNGLVGGWCLFSRITLILKRTIRATINLHAKQQKRTWTQLSG
ncbi:MAG: hypothetical protein DBX56_08430 [Coriobacteriia bacterium]|nr:MAG: hypothetical protein DBX56_08430 [Coriobacteriia bacterium]